MIDIKNKTKEEIVSITIDFLKGCAELENRTFYTGFCLIDKKIILNKIEQLENLLYGDLPVTNCPLEKKDE